MLSTLVALDGYFRQNFCTHFIIPSADSIFPLKLLIFIPLQTKFWIGGYIETATSRSTYHLYWMNLKKHLVHGER